jgi:hypothetical protein
MERSSCHFQLQFLNAVNKLDSWTLMNLNGRLFVHISNHYHDKIILFQRLFVFNLSNNISETLRNFLMTCPADRKSISLNKTSRTKCLFMVYPVHNSLNWTPWFEHLTYLLEEKRSWSWVIHISIRMVVNRRSLDSSLSFFINSVDLLAISLIRRAIEAKGVPTWTLTTLSFQNLKMKLWIVTCDDSCFSWAFNITGQENSPDIGWPSHTSPYPPPSVPKHSLTITQHGW